MKIIVGTNNIKDIRILEDEFAKRGVVVSMVSAKQAGVNIDKINLRGKSCRDDAKSLAQYIYENTGSFGMAMATVEDLDCVSATAIIVGSSFEIYSNNQGHNKENVARESIDGVISKIAKIKA